MMPTQQFYEVGNPSDPTSIEADDDTVAAIAGLFIGSGQYSVKRMDGTTVLPILMFGGAAALEAWLAERGLDVDAFMATRALDVADCLESVLLVRPSGRATIMASLWTEDPAARSEAMARFNEAKRSSMTNIAGSAIAIAKAIRVKFATAATMPPGDG